MIEITAQEQADIDFAEAFAKYHHRKVGQVRKFSGEPYEVHLQGCVDILLEHAHEVPVHAHMLQTMWLHDTVEDTEVTHEQIVINFGMQIGVDVHSLTNQVFEGANAERKLGEQMFRLSQAPPYVQTLKYVDIIQNTSDSLDDPNLDIKWAGKYGGSKVRFLEFVKGGDSILWKRAYESAKAFKEIA